MMSRLVLALSAAVLLVLAVLLVMQLRQHPQVEAAAPTPPPVPAPAPTPPPAAPTLPERPRVAAPKPPDAGLSPRETLAKGELPYPPPYFQDPRDRDRFKRWWVNEMVRRADVLRRLEPDRQYPNDQEIEHMMGRLYDLVEPPGETSDLATATRVAERQQEYFQLANKDFVKAFGVPATEIVRRGGDPKWGTASEPPVLPPDWKGP